MPPHVQLYSRSPFELPGYRAAVRRTTLVPAEGLSSRLGVDLFLASETDQHTGSFKFRAAYRVAAAVPHRRLITASSGNFGQALAYACRLLGKGCTVVMPDNSAQVKVEGVRRHGATVDLIATSRVSRAARVAELAAADPKAYIASPYDDPLVIHGNSSLGEELAASGRTFDVVIVPIGGGGLASGVVTGLRRAGSAVPVLGAEPLAGNDAARSLQAGALLANEQEPQTMADGARTVSLGQHNWALLQHGLLGITEVAEAEIGHAVRLLRDAGIRAEPTGAVALGALLTETDRFRGARVCAIVSGGNVDEAVYAGILCG